MKVLGIGESVIDEAKTDAVKAVSKHVGGPTPIALMLLSRLGIDCTLMTTLGRDANGEIIERALAKENVQMIAQRQETTKVNTYIIGTDGSRKKIRGGTTHSDISDINRNWLQQFDLIIIDRHEKKAFYEILEKKKNSTKIVIDPSTEVSPLTLDMIQYADYPIVPIEALAKIDEGRDLNRCLKKLYQVSKKPIIVTAGELGSIIYDGTMLEIIPALTIKAIDVQGAGDVYRGGFAYGILQGWDSIKSATFATIVAGLQCTKVGNASALPTKQEITDYQNRLAEEKMKEIHESFFNNVKQYE